MDIDQEKMQFLGFFGICRESYKIIFKWRKIFTQIALSFILPPSIISLLYIQQSEILFTRTIDQIAKHKTPQNTPTYSNDLSHTLSSDWSIFWLLEVTKSIFSLLVTSSIVYTVACIYTSRYVTFKNVITIVPKVGWRLIVTLLCISSAFFCYMIFIIISSFLVFVLLIAFSNTKEVIVFILFSFYLVGLAYITTIWQLASVVSVLEECYGFKAMARSRALLKGKMCVVFSLFSMVNISLWLLNFCFQKIVLQGWPLSLACRISFGVGILLLVVMLLLFWIVIKTVLYLVCKSYRHESIDKAALSNHLGVYLGEYLPLKNMDLQLDSVLGNV